MSYGFSAHDSSQWAGGLISGGEVHTAPDLLNSFRVADKPAFANPAEVLASATLTKEEKRSILASWASDVWAVVSAPALRLSPFTGNPVDVDDVLAALRALDGQQTGSVAGIHTISRRTARGRPLGARRRVLH